MTYYLVAYLAWQCPGGLLSGFIPESLKPTVCHAAPRIEAFEKIDLARKRIAQIGPQQSLQLVEVQGLRIKELPVTWTPL